MNQTRYKAEQRAALLDLLILGMYADAHLALAEDQRLNQVLLDLGIDEPTERRELLNAAVTRVRSSPLGRSELLGELCTRFSGPTECMSALGALQQVLAADGRIGQRERAFLADVEKLLS